MFNGGPFQCARRPSCSAGARFTTRARDLPCSSAPGMPCSTSDIDGFGVELKHCCVVRQLVNLDQLGAVLDITAPSACSILVCPCLTAWIRVPSGFQMQSQHIIAYFAAQESSFAGDSQAQALLQSVLQRSQSRSEDAAIPTELVALVSAQLAKHPNLDRLVARAAASFEVDRGLNAIPLLTKIAGTLPAEQQFAFCLGLGESSSSFWRIQGLVVPGLRLCSLCAMSPSSNHLSMLLTCPYLQLSPIGVACRSKASTTPQH